MSTLSNAKKLVDGKMKNLISGYVHEADKSIPYTTIPGMLNYIILLYYLVSDKFIKCSAYMNISSSDADNEMKDDIVTQDTRGTHWDMTWQTAHGNMIIDATQNPTAIAEWKIKINANLPLQGIIGLHTTYDDDKCYGMIATGFSKLFETEYDMHKCDTIKMELDVSKKQLKWYTNNESASVVVNDIDVSETYHLVISTFNDNCFQIKYFDIRNYDSLTFHTDC